MVIHIGFRANKLLTTCSLRITKSVTTKIRKCESLKATLSSKLGFSYRKNITFLNTMYEEKNFAGLRKHVELPNTQHDNLEPS